MFKKIISLFTAICMIFMLWDIPFTASAETYGEFEYKVIEENEIQIRDYKGSSAEVVIPETIDGKPVTTIYELSGSTVTKVTIPKTVKTIYGAAFLTPNLTEVCFDGFSEGFVYAAKSSFPESVTKIVFPANMTDQDIKLKMTLTVFPSGAALYSGTEPLPHDYVFKPCEDGLQHYQICTACDQIKENSYEDHIGEGDFIIDPAYNNETNHYQKCKCGMVIGDLHMWNEGTVTTEPTEETEGVMTYTCTVCSKTKTDSIDRLEHTHMLTPHEAISAACITGGNKAYWTCSGCNKIFADENGTTEIDEIPTIPALGHNYVNGKCSVCQAIDKNHVCTGGTATCQKKAVCTICGKEYGGFGEHTDETIPEVPETCTTAGSTAGVKCSACGTVLTAPTLVPAAGHSLDNGAETTPATCTEKGIKIFSCENCDYTETAEIAALGHNYADGKCTLCHSADPNYTPAVTEPTVTEPTVTEPTVTEPTVTEPTVTEPTVTEPTVTVTTVTEPPVTYPYIPSGTSSSYQPTVTADSQKIIDLINAAVDGGTVEITLNGTTTVDKTVFEAMQGRDITVVFKLSCGAYWTINGKDITKAKTVDLGVQLNKNAVPASKIKKLAGDKKTVQFTLNHSGDLGFTGILNVPFGKAYNGKFANLYYYSKGEFEFAAVSEISGGIGAFAFTHASDYAAVIDDYSYTEDVSSEAGAYENNEADNNIHYIFIAVIIAVLGSLTIIIAKRSAKKCG